VMLGEQGEEPKMKSLLPTQTPETITLEQALQLLSLPREVGIDPASNDPIRADLGRFGPYLRKGTDSRSMPSPDQLFTLTLEQALEIFAKPKSFRRGPQILKEVGKHPKTEAVINLYNGRYGPYVSDGELNASIPRSMAPEQVTLETAVQLLEDRAQQAPRKPMRKRAQMGAKGAKPAKRTPRAAKAAANAGAAPAPTARPKSRSAKRARG